MRAMLSLKVLIHHDDGLLGPVLPCCDVTITSNHTLALAASSRPSKNMRMASRVSAIGGVVPHVADEPRRIPHVLRCVAPRHQLLRHAAAIAPRERSHVHLTKLGRGHAAQRRAQRGPQPGKIRECNALQHSSQQFHHAAIKNATYQRA